MSLTRVQNFSISLDGFGTGDVQTLDAPFGHAGERLHEWMFATRWGGTMFGRVGGSAGVDDAFARQHETGVGAEIMGAGGLDVRIGGGVTVIRDFVAARLIDRMHVVVVPFLLGRGQRLWDGLEGIEQDYDIEATSSPSGVTHVTFTRTDG